MTAKPAAKSKSIELEVESPKAPSKPVPFEPGSEHRSILAPRQSWLLSTPGVKASAPRESGFDVTADLLEDNVFVFRLSTADKTKLPFEALGRDIAEPGQRYQFNSYGDGTALLTMPGLAPGCSIYIPSARYDDQGAFSQQNAGVWTVERAGTVASFLRSDSLTQLGTTETVEAVAASDIQLLTRAEHASVLIVGFVSGVFPVVAATPRWVAVRLPGRISEGKNITLAHFEVVESYMGSCTVQTDQPAEVKLNGLRGSSGSVVIVPDEPGVESEMSKYEVHGFVTDLSVENLSTQPMKLRVAFRLGK